MTNTTSGALVHHPTALLPQLAAEALARLTREFAPALAEQRRIEHRLSGLAVGESAVVNGTECTVISLDTADLLERGRAVSAQCRRLSVTAVTSADFDELLAVQDEMAMCRCQLAAAGRLDLIGGGV